MEKLAINGGKSVRKEKLWILKPYFGKEETNAASRVIKSGIVEGGNKISEEFEEKLAKYLGVKHCIFLNSCTAALHLALILTKSFNGELISPTYTFTSTAMVGLHNKLNPILADVEYETANLDVNSFEEAITKKTRAVMPMHFAGHACDMDRINKIAKENNIFVIEDAAHAIGASYKGKKLGAISDLGCFSFHGTKNLVCGEGGALVTNNDIWAEKVHILKEKGTKKHFFAKEKDRLGRTFEAVSAGFSFIQSDILAAIALEQLKKLDKMNGMRDSIAKYYNSKLSKLSLIKAPTIKEYAKTNWHLYMIKVPKEHKDFIIQALNKEGISANIHYKPLHLHSLYNKLGYKKGDFPNAEKVFDTYVRLPLYPGMTKKDREDVVHAVDKVVTYINEKF